MTNRYINVKVSGNRLTKDSNSAGTRGEANTTSLRIEFDESWDNLAKSVVFRDAHGMNPTIRNLTTDLLENIVDSARIYIVPIPREALGVAGEIAFVIEGYYVEYNEGGEPITRKRQRAMSSTLEVDDAYVTDAESDPTPSQYEQLNGQYAEIVNTIRNAEIYKNEAKTHADDAKASADDAETSADEAKTSMNNALSSANKAEEHKNDAAEYSGLAEGWADTAKDYAHRAENSLDKVSYIGENGNWFAWDIYNEAFYDTGVRAQAGSEVYVGSNPPASAGVWIDPNGNEYDIIAILNTLEKKVEALKPRIATINLPASAWVESADEEYSQVVPVENVPLHCEVELQITKEQVAIFRDKDITFWVESENSVVTVYCIGQKPTNDYVFQVKITEVSEDE